MAADRVKATPSDDNSAGSRSSKACSSCRKRKQKCDAVKRFPLACTRCEKKSHFCELDSGLKRSTAYNGRSPGSTGRNEDSPDDSRPPIAEIANTVFSSSVFFGNTGELLEPLSDISDTTIQGILIPKDTIVEMYTAYTRYYHPQYPIIPSLLLQMKPSPIFVTCRGILLWAMCLVACPVVHPQLQPALRTHMQMLISSGCGRNYLFRPVETLTYLCSQLLCAYFPCGARRLQDDNGYFYVGLATSIAFRLGAHQALYSPKLNEQNEKFSVKEGHLLAWGGLYLAHHTHSGSNGVPSMLPSTTYNFRFLKEYEDPHRVDFYKSIQIVRVYRRFIHALTSDSEHENGNITPEARGPIYDLFTEELSHLTTELCPLSKLTEMHLLYCKLLMNMFFLIPDMLEQDTKRVIIPIYINSVRAAKTLTEIKESGGQLATLPLFVFRMIVANIIVLYRILASPYKSMVNEDSCFNCISELYRHLQEMEKAHSRGCTFGIEFVDALQKMFVEGQLSPKLCKIGTRQASSVIVYTMVEYLYWQKSKNPDYVVDPPKVDSDSSGHGTTQSSELNWLLRGLTSEDAGSWASEMSGNLYDSQFF
ncbi:hypothetical protein TRVA0_077S00298 [Trichomonascus vanleenenianus]|uniref:Zn(II)2Cys6 transcription factor n=1 Tax=Trichomonascus vanleenenianus TaxID=2268995 RepID=UPI003ECABDBE